MSITAEKEMKLRFKRNATENELWIDVAFNNNHFEQDLKNIFGESELYTYEHQFNPSLGERVLVKYPSKGFKIYRVKYSIEKDQECFIEVNDIKIPFSYKIEKSGRSALLKDVYKLNDVLNKGKIK
jgi:hypothetical protein